MGLFFVGMQWSKYHRDIGTILLVNIPLWLLMSWLFGIVTGCAMERRYGGHLSGEETR